MLGIGANKSESSWKLRKGKSKTWLLLCYHKNCLLRYTLKDWHCLTDDDIISKQELKHFITSTFQHGIAVTFPTAFKLNSVSLWIIMPPVGESKNIFWEGIQRHPGVPLGLSWHVGMCVLTMFSRGAAHCSRRRSCCRLFPLCSPTPCLDMFPSIEMFVCLNSPRRSPLIHDEVLCKILSTPPGKRRTWHH